MNPNPKPYEIPYRPPFELYASASWLLCATATIWVVLNTPFPKFPFFWALPFALGMALIRGIQGYAKWVEVKKLKGSPLQLIDHLSLFKKTPPAEVQKSIWLGQGFDWTVDATARTHQIIHRGPETIMGEMTKGGAHWLHAVGSGEQDMGYLTDYMVGHTAIEGTTGSGKTRLLDLIITQLASRGVNDLHPKAKDMKRECVIILDPKGDKGLFENAKALCEASGEPDRFVYFNPAFPEKSACIDVLRNFATPTELASRIASIIPSETGTDPFVAFGWKTLNDICAGCFIVNERPNLLRLRRYVEGGITSLLQRTLESHFEKHIPGWQSLIQPFAQRKKNDPLAAAIEFHQQVVSERASNPVIDGLINGYTHERTHYQKMTASLIPVLTMLTTGHLGDLLSPDPAKLTDKVCTDIASIIASRKICYIALNSLADGTVASAIGSMILSDITSVAGSIYNFDLSQNPVNVVIDEVGEVINAPTIQLLNKGRGAGFRVVIAYQTIADLVVRTGSEHAARKVMGNINNLIALRLHDNETRDHFVEKCGKIKIPSLEIAYRSGSDSKDPTNFGAAYSEAVKETEVDRIPPAILSQLPNLHYFGAMADGRIIKARIPVLVNDPPLPVKPPNYDHLLKAA